MAVDVPKIVLVPHEKSHPFTSRECVIHEPLKVGRSVDKRRISSSNLIFDCRVLSRNHALIWFENGKFYIQDTKSSNGTFVNASRLSPSGEESGSVELKSRDILQFGVNVNVEKKVTHGCIIATIHLYVNDIELPGLDPPVKEVMEIVQSALGREEELERKLASMQEVLNAARQLASDSMIAIVREDELLSRLEMLENQLQVYSRNSPEDELKRQLSQAFEEKRKNEITSKDSMRALLQEKLECVAKLNQLQRDYDKAEQECERYKILYDAAKLEHSSEVTQLSGQLRNAEKDKKAIGEKLAAEKQVLTATMESLKADVDFTQKQLNAAKARLKDTEDELFELKVRTEAERQRRIKGMESTSTSDTMDSLEFGIDVGEGDDMESFRVVSEDTLHPVAPGSPKAPLPVEEGEALRTRSVGLGGPPPPRLGQLKGTAIMQVQTSINEPSLSLETVGGQRWRRKSGEAGERPGFASLTEVAKVVTEAAIAKGQVELLQDSLSEAEEQIRSLQVQLQSETEKRRLMNESVTAMGGQLTHCYAELEVKHAEVLRMKGELSEKEARVSILEKQLQRCQVSGGELQTANSTLEDRLSSLHQDFSLCSQEEAKIKAENTKLNREIQRLRLGRHQHFPAAEDQRVKLLTIIALVSIGVALASWFT